MTAQPSINNGGFRLTKRQLHATIAGTVALICYIAVVTVVAGNPATWHAFGQNNCQNAIDASFCIIAGTIIILFKVITVGLLLALTSSIIYLKVAKFSTASAFAIPIAAHLAVAAVILVSLQLHLGVSMNPLSLGALPLAYVALSLITRRK